MNRYNGSENFFDVNGLLKYDLLESDIVNERLHQTRKSQVRIKDYKQPEQKK
jgi:hypothetical protein